MQSDYLLLIYHRLHQLDCDKQPRFIGFEVSNGLFEAGLRGVDGELSALAQLCAAGDVIDIIVYEAALALLLLKSPLEGEYMAQE